MTPEGGPAPGTRGYGRLVQDTLRTLVRRHGGDITCESTLGQGTTFTFTLAQPRPERAL